MIIIEKIRVQLLNGNNIIKQIPVEEIKEFEGLVEFENYRKEMIKYHKAIEIPKYKLENPGKDLPKIDVLFDRKEI